MRGNKQLEKLHLRLCAGKKYFLVNNSMKQLLWKEKYLIFVTEELE